MSNLGGGRIRYIDTLRGFTMLLVVFQHIRQFSIGLGSSDSAIAAFFISFRMPMFFFISGYVAYKAVHHWTWSFYSHRLLTKARVQLFPTIVFWALYIIVIGMCSFPGGFWFTESLFEMFILYFSIAFCCNRCKLGGKTESITIILSILAVLLFNRWCPQLHDKYHLVLGSTSKFYIFFGIGLLMKKYNDKFIHFLESKVTITVLIVGAVLCLISLYKYQLFGNYRPVQTGVLYLTGLLLVYVIFAAFHNNATFWNKKGWVQNTMEYIGRRTLDLYMIHSFLLPDLHQLRPFLTSGNNEIVIEFFVIGILTLMVTGCALLISSLLRTSPVLAKWLFGVTNKMPQNLKERVLS